MLIKRTIYFGDVHIQSEIRKGKIREAHYFLLDLTETFDTLSMFSRASNASLSSTGNGSYAKIKSS
jgi:hypothetical protein